MNAAKNAGHAAFAQRHIDASLLQRACGLADFTRSPEAPYHWTLGFFDVNGAPLMTSDDPQIALRVDGDRFGIIKLPRTDADYLRCRHAEESVTYASYLERDAFFNRLHAFRGELAEVLAISLAWRAQPVHQLITRLLIGNREQLEELWLMLTEDEATVTRLRGALSGAESTAPDAKTGSPMRQGLFGPSPMRAGPQPA